jgi:hypothetical protein
MADVERFALSVYLYYSRAISKRERRTRAVAWLEEQVDDTSFRERRYLLEFRPGDNLHHGLA